nr:LysR family transcriptional regulator [Jiella flava]
MRLDDRLSIGPGKARLLAAIEETGSLAAAGRRMKMSYKRAWLLVDEMNRAFREPLVSAARGGSSGGGAKLTETGRTVLTAYRASESLAEAAVRAHVEALRRLLCDPTSRKEGGGDEN